MTKEKIKNRQLARNANTARYLCVSPMSLWRWKNDPDLKFPNPHVINGVEWNDLDKIDDWLMDHIVIKNKPLAMRKGRSQT